MFKTARKRKTAAVVIAFTMIIAMIAASLVPTYAGTAVSDADTSGSYETNLGDDSSTQYAGRIWADKSVYTENHEFTGELSPGTGAVDKGDSDFLVAYSALATTQKITGKSQVPVDVVFVIDNSGSMDYEWGFGIGATALEQTVEAVNQSIETVMESNPNSRVAVVAYDGAEGNTSAAQVLLPLDHYSKSGNTYIQANYDRFIIVRHFENLSVSNGVSTSEGRTYSNTIYRGSGGTNIHAGVQKGMDILDNASSVDSGGITHMPALILLSDGAATYSGSGDWWNCTGQSGTGGDTNYAHTMKVDMNAQYMKQQVNEHYGLTGTAGYSCRIYTIGMGFSDLSGSDRQYAQMALNPTDMLSADNDVSNTIRSAWNIYRSGRSVSLDSYTFTHPESGDISTLQYNDEYYEASNADDVNAVFSDITSDIIASAPQAPTQIEGGDPLDGGYLTYTDPIGEYMQVDDVKAILYGGHRFDQKEKNTEGNTTTYTFAGTIHSDVYGDLDASNIHITVTEDNDGNQTLTVSIPAAAIPLRVTNIDIDSNGSISNTSNGAYPARICYTVSARDGVNLETLEGVSDEYINNHLVNTENGPKVNFYSNRYSGTQQNGKTVGDANITFTAATTNPFFYIQENTPLYLDEDCTRPATGVENNDTLYYFRTTYYEGSREVEDTISRPGSSFYLEGSINDTIIDIDGQANIKQGAPRLGYLDEFEMSKNGNETSTAAEAFHPVYNGNGTFTAYLGNNGLLQVDAPKSLTVEKEVTATEGLTAPDKTFTFEATIASKAGTTGSAVKTAADGTESNVDLTFDADGKTTFTLKDGESIEILNVGEGVAYSVVETNIPDGFTSDASNNTISGSVSSNNEDNILTFTNTYDVEPVTTENLGINLFGAKSITGRDFDAGDSFEFTIAAAQVTPNAPLPESTTVTVNPTSGSETTFEFGDITFDKPGEYRYLIRETYGTIPGIDYDASIFRVNIVVQDNGDGTMSLASADGLTGIGGLQYPSNPFTQEFVAGQGSVVDSVLFENNYSATSADVNIHGTKVLNVTNSDRRLADDDFSFNIEALGYNTDGGDQFSAIPQGEPEQPMPEETTTTNIANGDVNFGTMTFTQDMIGNTYGYKITEVVPAGADSNHKLNGITYDVSEKIVKVTVTRSGEGGTEHVVATITPDDGTQSDPNHFTFTNTYEPSSITIGNDTTSGLTVEKTFTGKTWEDEEFTYTLTPQGNAPALAETELTIGKPESGTTNTGSFGEITFTEEGTYRYEITETNAGQTVDGITYDDNTAVATVTVTEDQATGTLSAEVTYSNSANDAVDTASFTNTYEAVFDTDTAATLTGTKELTGKTLTNGMFYFTVTDEDGTTVTRPVSEDGTFTILDHETYDAAGDYVYTVKEQIPDPKALGMTYDESEYRVTVTVTDDGKGNLTAAEPVIEKKARGAADYEAADAVVFNNSYAPLAGTATPVTLTKVLAGTRNTPLQDGEFSFELSVVSANPQDGIQLPADTVVENDANGTVQFGAITFTKPGTYTVQAREVIPAVQAPGITYDNHVITRTYTVVDRDGQLVARGAAPVGGRTFTNEYGAQGSLDGATNLVVTKEISGRDWTNNDSFTFTLSADEDYGDAVTLPDETTVTITDSTPDHQAAFGDIKFTAEGEYAFTIKETDPQIDNMTYDNHEMHVVVNVVDEDGLGTLTATPTVTGSSTFTNVHNPNAATATLAGTKTFTGREIKDTDSFTFNIAKADGSEAETPMPAETSVTVEGKDFKDGEAPISFGTLSYDKEGTYIYDITETKGSIGGVQYDEETVTATVEVTYDDQAGVFNTNVTYSKTGGGNAFEFENVYEADPTDPVTGFSASKTVTPSEGNSYSMDADTFEFTLTPSTSNPASDPVKAVTAKNDANGAVSFVENATYTEPGQYIYTIQETPNGVAGITYDSSVYTLTVNVTDDGSGKLTATKSLTKDGAEATAISFNNTYDPAETGLAFAGTKELTGKDLAADEFTFVLTAVDGAPMPTDAESIEAKNDEGGAFSFGEITYDRAGEYQYTISEKNTGETGVTYDTNVYNITVNVTDEDGVLRAVPSVTNEEIVFKNSYKPIPLVLTGDTAIGGTKTLTGRDLKAGEFSFELMQDGEVVDTAKNDASGNFRFKDITIEEPGTYHYTVSEVMNGLGGVTYDQRMFDVVVDARDEAGNITADVYYMRDGEQVDKAAFTNEYTAAGTSVELGATKILKGRDLEEGEFDFVLEDAKTGDLIAKASNREDGSIVFDRIDYDKAGTYDYVVRELSGNDDAITYDDTKYNVTVKVTDDRQGHLKAEITSEGHPIFTNVCEEEEPTVTPENPKTGDDNHLGLYLLMMGASGAALFAVRRRIAR